MTKLELDQYQIKIEDDCRDGFKAGHKWIMVQAPTRSGKTVIFANMVNSRIMNLKPDEKKVDTLILVHDQKIMRQIKKTLYQWHFIVAHEITSKTKHIEGSLSLFDQKRPRVFIAMVETINNRLRLPSFLLEMQKVGFIIADEAHLSNFKKIYKHPLFIDIYRLGFSATPISADKNDPLYPTYFTHLVCGPQVRELIAYNQINPARGVVKCVTYVIDKNVDRDKVALDADGNYNDESAGEELSGRMQVKNTFNAIITKCFGKKLICFNQNKSHSRLVCAYLLSNGLNARHMDSDSGEEWIQDTLAWFKRTPGAILCNVRMTTTGFDEPSCEGTIINTLTKSFSLIKQMEARGGTPYKYPNGKYKEVHYVLDMCNNTIEGKHGEWSDDVDWGHLFYHPKYSVPGVAPKKECKACSAVNSASARVCCVCGHPFDVSVPTADNVEKSMRLISKDIDIAHTVEVFSNRNEYAAMFDILRQSAFLARKRLTENPSETFEYLLEEEEFEEIFLEAQQKITEWRKYIGKKTIDIQYNSIRSAMEEKLEHHGFILNFKASSEAIFATKKKI